MAPQFLAWPAVKSVPSKDTDSETPRIVENTESITWYLQFKGPIRERIGSGPKRHTNLE